MADAAGSIATILSPVFGMQHNYWAMVAAVVPVVAARTRPNPSTFARKASDMNTQFPHIVGNTDALTNAGADDRGAVWKLEDADRDLDSNLIHLPAGEAIGDFDGPDLDSLVVVLSGSGTLRTAEGEIALEPGQIVWLPKHSRRGYQAGPNGLGYLTVHQRRRTEPLMPRIRPHADR